MCNSVESSRAKRGDQSARGLTRNDAACGLGCYHFEVNSIPDLVLNYRGISFVQELFGLSAEPTMAASLPTEGACVDRGRIFRTVVESSTFRFLSDGPCLSEDATPRFPSGRATRCAHLSRRLEIIKGYLRIF